MNWQQWLPLATLILGAIGGFSVAQAKVKQLRDRNDWLRVALGKMMRSTDKYAADPYEQANYALTEARRLARKVLDGESTKSD